jgi:hypothetical protein
LLLTCYANRVESASKVWLLLFTRRQTIFTTYRVQCKRGRTERSAGAKPVSIALACTALTGCYHRLLSHKQPEHNERLALECNLISYKKPSYIITLDLFSRQECLEILC